MCISIEKLKEDKDVPRARAEPSRVVRWCGLVLPLGLAKEEEGVQARLKRSYLRVSYHPLWW